MSCWRVRKQSQGDTMYGVCVGGGGMYWFMTLCVGVSIDTGYVCMGGVSAMCG